MSNHSSDGQIAVSETQAEEEAEISGLLGGKVSDHLDTNPDEIEVSLALNTIRAFLTEACQTDQVGVNELATRLHISPAAVSRFLNSGADMKVSTAVLYGRALGRSWNFRLTDRHLSPLGNERARIIDLNQATISRTSAAPPDYHSIGPAAFGYVDALYGNQDLVSAISPAEIQAFALFVDDIRLEIGNKLTLVGQYGTDLALPAGGIPIDRLAVYVLIRMPYGKTPPALTVRIELPGQAPASHGVPTPAPSALPDTGQSPSPFASTIVQAIFQLRFPPMRVGDNIDVWVVADGHEIPAGRLRISELPPTDVTASA